MIETGEVCDVFSSPFRPGIRGQAFDEWFAESICAQFALSRYPPLPFCARGSVAKNGNAADSCCLPGSAVGENLMHVVPGQEFCR